MKNFKKMMALVIAMVMCLGMALPAMAAVPENGSITVNSPILGAKYSAYKVFDMAVNDGVTAFSYSISSDNPFFSAVQKYANMPAQLPDANADGLTLTVTADTADATVKVYNVSVTSAFDPQAFGQALLAAMKDTENPISATAAAGPTTVTVNDTDNIKFDNLDLGYFLITSEYPKADFSTVTMTVKTYGGTASTDEADKYVFNKDSLADPAATTLALTDDAKTKINEYVTKTVTDEYVQAYINDKHLVDKDAAGNEIAIANPSTRWTEVKNEIINTMKADAEKQILAALKNQLEGSESDINLAKEPILVFLDSSQPDAVINEKNELDKWDVPVNPSGDALPENLPDYGEPGGGKNIVVTPDGVNPAVYADWSEAEIGESVHYQLRVNAMNFVRETAQGDEAVQTTADKVTQVKEYFLADFQSGHMHFDADKFLRITVIDNNGTNVTRNGAGEKVDYLDYTDLAASKFFKNTTKQDAAEKPSDVFGDGTGIMIPWVKVSEKNPATPDANFPIYTETKVPTGQNYKPTAEEIAEHNYVVDSDGYALDENNARIPLYDTYYVYSLYNSDVTIVADYYMVLEDNAVVDEPGNKNYAQYGYSPVDVDDGTGIPKTPSVDDKPSQKKEVDEATVYTFALAWVKVDNKANPLAGAEFELPFYVKAAKDGDTYVYGGKTAGEGLTNKVTTTTTSAVITIKGVEQGVYSITETKAPDGFNKLDAPFDVEAKKSGNGVTTKTETIIYLDAQGNVTDTVTTTTKTYETDEDSYNKETPAVTGQETSVPVYQFDPVVNQKGQELPATGGMGTTLFYAIGAILVLGAGILLVSKRRMSAN